MPTASEALMARLKRSFGFDPAESKHHFRVFIPRGNQQITISEHLTWDEEKGSSPATLSPTTDGEIRVLLSRAKWDAIASVTRAEFNRRLRQQGKPSGMWLTGENWVRLDLGKELVLLAWAIEEADPALIQNAIVNWLGLYPEERWWLYTQTAAASGQAIQGRSLGWRKAVRFALTENPIEKTEVPEFYLRAEAVEQRYLLETPSEYSSPLSEDSKDESETNGID
ncbi:DUF3780 domain-containing protein [Bellilinea sp.]|uniref:DUF3780 domain-containing protein n=1 Tax=Bellilinea sp. TaxID=2838785 RepID=UPI0021DCE8FC|nr:DUF3780 domain-containing protein [Bellilinea sp.]GIV64889.1 MAG: hypothetical protein KatS3mg046_149 [Bellilinea sp.]